MTGTDEVLDPQTPSEQPDPRDIARAVAMDAADAPEQVGEVVDAIELGDNVTDFRLAAAVRGYEGWQWSVTLYHDTEVGTWTVNESSLVPTDDALMPPAWIPWKDRLEPTDLAPTDSIGTDPDDPRLEDGFRKTEPVQASGDAEAGSADAAVSTNVDKPEQAGESADGDAETSAENAESASDTENATNVDMPAGVDESTNVDKAVENAAAAEAGNEADATAETDEIVEEFALSRRHVLSPQGRAQVAKRWYEGPRGPKALSTKTADGNLCSTCGFFVPLKGELNLMFGVCANKWSPDDGRVVSVDHGCGEHSEIEPPEPSHLWVQSKPAYDDFHIDVIAQKPRDERGVVEAIEQLDDDEQNDEATEEDILANTEPDDGDDEANETQPSGVDATAELEAVVDVAAAGDDEADDESDDSAVDSTDEMSDDKVDDAVDDNSVDEPVDGETEDEPVDSASEGETDAVAVDSTDEASVDESADGSVDESAEVTVDESVDEPVDEAAEPEAEPETETGLDPVPNAEQLELIEESTETVVEVAVEEAVEPEEAEAPESEPESEPEPEPGPEPAAEPEPDQEDPSEA